MNTTILAQIELFAQQYWERLGDHFRGGRTASDTERLLTVVAITVGFAFGLYLLQRFAPQDNRSKLCNSPRELFGDLCRAHRLDHADRRLLKQLAAAWQLASPAYLFTEPDYFDTAALPVEWQDKAQRMALIRARLFGAV